MEQKLFLVAVNTWEIYNAVLSLVSALDKNMRKGVVIEKSRLETCSTMKQIVSMTAKQAKSCGGFVTANDRKNCAVQVAQFVMNEVESLQVI